MNQTTLFSPHECQEDALGADITAAGGFKVVAGKLWPADSSGPAKLRNYCNREQPHKPELEEVLAIKKLAREAGSTALIDFEAQQLGYQVKWLDPKDEGDELRRQFIEATAALGKLAQRIEKADERALRVVR